LAPLPQPAPEALQARFPPAIERYQSRRRLATNLFIHILELAQHFIEFPARSGSVRAFVRHRYSAAVGFGFPKLPVVIPFVASCLSGKAGLATIVKA
jgi:hypothetical protein